MRRRAADDAADGGPSIHLAVSPAAAPRYATVSQADDVDGVLFAVAPVVLAMAAEHGVPSAAPPDFVRAHDLPRPWTPYRPRLVIGGQAQAVAVE